jgi:hypothetical protein
MVIGLAVAVVLAGPVVVFGVHVTHPRDEDGYLAYLARYGDPDTAGPVPALPPTADLIAEGDAACDWLREQPFALWRTNPECRYPALYGRYRRHDAGRVPRWGTAPPGTGNATTAAWHYLCAAD